MALIKCNNCGGHVSDKAKACPRCGAPIVLENVGNTQPAFNQQQNTEVQPGPVATPQPNHVATQQPAGYYEEPKRKSNAGLIVAAVLGLLALLGASGWLLYDNHQKRVEQERQMAILTEKARQDSIAAAELREQARQDSIERVLQQELIEKSRQSYINILKDYLERFGVDEYGWFGYFLYDITRDGEPELWVKAGTCEADFMLYVYTLKDGVATKIFEEGSSHSGFCRGNNYIIRHWAHMGYAAMYKLTYDGSKIKSRCIYEEDNIESSYDYKEPSEPAIHLNRFDDYSPVNEAFK